MSQNIQDLIRAVKALEISRSVVLNSTFSGKDAVHVAGTLQLLEKLQMQANAQLKKLENETPVEEKNDGSEKAAS